MKIWWISNPNSSLCHVSRHKISHKSSAVTRVYNTCYVICKTHTSQMNVDVSLKMWEIAAQSKTHKRQRSVSKTGNTINMEFHVN